jgi:glutamate synthase (NADPH/NADH) large chain
VDQPVLTNEDLERVRHIEDNTGGAFRTHTLDTTYPADDGAEGMAKALEGLCKQAEQAVLEGFNILILSDRHMNRDYIAIPALLATSAVHHHLIRRGLRTSSGLVVETGAALEAMGRRRSTPISPSTPSRRCCRACPSSSPSRRRRSATSRPSARACSR